MPGLFEVLPLLPFRILRGSLFILTGILLFLLCQFFPESVVTQRKFDDQLLLRDGIRRILHEVTINLLRSQDFHLRAEPLIPFCAEVRQYAAYSGAVLQGINDGLHSDVAGEVPQKTVRFSEGILVAGGICKFLQNGKCRYSAFFGGTRRRSCHPRNI